jgi:hypothetical protein
MARCLERNALFSYFRLFPLKGAVSDPNGKENIARKNSFKTRQSQKCTNKDILDIKFSSQIPRPQPISGSPRRNLSPRDEHYCIVCSSHSRDTPLVEGRRMEVSDWKPHLPSASLEISYPPTVPFTTDHYILGPRSSIPPSSTNCLAIRAWKTSFHAS